MERFRIEYLGQLKNSKHKLPTTLTVGQLLVVSDNTKRIKWPIAKIFEFYFGKNNYTREDRVKTMNGEFL